MILIVSPLAIASNIGATKIIQYLALERYTNHMTHWLITYVSCLVGFVVIDGAWIFLVARKLYDVEAGEIIRDKPQLAPGIIFYLLYAAGITVFSVLPLTGHFDGMHAVLATYGDVAAWGAGLGIFAYSTFSLTNQSIIKQWRYKLALADTFWGAVVTALVSLLGFMVYRVLAA